MQAVRPGPVPRCPAGGRGRARCAGPALATALVLACAGSPPKSRFEREFPRYLSLPNQKAMAVAGDLDGRWVYGTGYAFRSSGRARDKAMEQCNVRRKGLGPDAECRIHAVGSRVVSGAEAEWGGD